MFNYLQYFIKEEKNIPFVGLIQSILVAVYVAKVGFFMNWLTSHLEEEPGFIGVFFILTLFVFSAAVTATLVFGVTVYLMFEKKAKEGLQILLFTLFFLFIILSLVFFGILLTQS